MIPILIATSITCADINDLSNLRVYWLTYGRYRVEAKDGGCGLGYAGRLRTLRRPRRVGLEKL